MEEAKLKTLIDQLTTKLDSKVKVKKLEYTMDFGSVSAVVSMCHN